MQTRMLYLFFFIVGALMFVHLGVVLAQGVDAGVVVGAGSGIGSGSGAVQLPTEVTDQASFLYKLYKAGHLIPALILGGYFLLYGLQQRLVWFQTGYRKVIVVTVLAGLGMLVERAASGTTPNLMMWMGAVGAAFTMWLKTHGQPAEQNS